MGMGTKVEMENGVGNLPEIFPTTQRIKYAWLCLEFRWDYVASSSRPATLPAIGWIVISVEANQAYKEAVGMRPEMFVVAVGVKLAHRLNCSKWVNTADKGHTK